MILLKPKYIVIQKSTDHPGRNFWVKSKTKISICMLYTSTSKHPTIKYSPSKPQLQIQDII